MNGAVSPRSTAISAALSLRPDWGIRSYLLILVLAAVLPLAALIGFRIYSDAAEHVQREADASRCLVEQTALFVSRFLDDTRVALEAMA